jgi:DNA mismatch repair ATPase MutL
LTAARANAILFVMRRIQELSHHVVKKVAAGEAIERRASVEALAIRIDIDIVERGLEPVRIVDDACGCKMNLPALPKR